MNHHVVIVYKDQMIVRVASIDLEMAQVDDYEQDATRITESRSIWRSILSKNVASKQKVSSVLVQSSRMESNSSLRSDNLVPSREVYCSFDTRRT